jgi:hypothetical protein
VACEIEDFLRRLAEKKIDTEGFSIDINLIYSAGNAIKGLEQIHSGMEPHAATRPSTGRCKSLYDALGEMKKYGATKGKGTDVHPYPYESDVWVSPDGSDALGEDAIEGGIDMTSQRPHGTIFGSRTLPAAYEPPFKLAADLVPLSVILVLMVWLLEAWPPVSGGML